MTAQYEIRKAENDPFNRYMIVDTETGKDASSIKMRYSKPEDAQEDLDELVSGTSETPDYSLQVAIYGDDPASEKPLPTEEASKAEEKLPESIIIDGENEIGSTIEYKGQQWTVTSSGFYSERDQRADENGGMGSLNIGWHSWLRKV